MKYQRTIITLLLITQILDVGLTYYILEVMDATTEGNILVASVLDYGGYGLLMYIKFVLWYILWIGIKKEIRWLPYPLVAITIVYVVTNIYQFMMIFGGLK